MLIKCAGEYWQLEGCGEAAAFGFTVRINHAVVHQEVGIRPWETGEVRLTAVGRALQWLLTYSADPAEPVEVRTDAFLPGIGHLREEIEALLEAHRLAGREIRLVPLESEWVSEASALCHRKLLEHLVQGEIAGTCLPAQPSSWRARKRVTLPTDLCMWPLVGGEGATLNITCDGSYRRLWGEPGTSTYAYMVWENLRLVHRESGVVCRGENASSVVSEFGAVVAALRWLVSAPVGEGVRVEIHSDFRQVVEVMSAPGARPTGRGTATLCRTALRLLRLVRSRGCLVWFRHAERLRVTEADQLARSVHEEEPGELSTKFDTTGGTLRV